MGRPEPLRISDTSVKTQDWKGPDSISVNTPTENKTSLTLFAFRPPSSSATNAGGKSWEI